MSKGHGFRESRVEVDEAGGCASDQSNKESQGVDARKAHRFPSGILKLWIQIEEEVAG